MPRADSYYALFDAEIKCLGRLVNILNIYNWHNNKYYSRPIVSESTYIIPLVHAFMRKSGLLTLIKSWILI